MLEIGHTCSVNHHQISRHSVQVWHIFLLLMTQNFFFITILQPLTTMFSCFFFLSTRLLRVEFSNLIFFSHYTYYTFLLSMTHFLLFIISLLPLTPVFSSFYFLPTRVLRVEFSNFNFLSHSQFININNSSS